MRLGRADDCDVGGFLEELADSLIGAFSDVFGDNLVSLVLFGSYARGEPRRESDIDLLVVLERIDDRYALQRSLDDVEEALAPLLKRMGSCGFTPVLSSVVLSKEQASGVRPLYLDLVFDARVLYDKGGFMSEVLGAVRERLAALGAERRRIGKKWVVILKRDFRFGEVVEL